MASHLPTHMASRSSSSVIASGETAQRICPDFSHLYIVQLLSFTCYSTITISLLSPFCSAVWLSVVHPGRRYPHPGTVPCLRALSLYLPHCVHRHCLSLPRRRGPWPPLAPLNATSVQLLASRPRPRLRPLLTSTSPLLQLLDHSQPPPTVTTPRAIVLDAQPAPMGSL